jgi:antitoxin component YwqK of YwqJK toxin-antitoxin module
VEYQIKKYRNNFLVISLATFCLAILIIILLKNREVDQNYYRSNPVINNGLIYLEGQSFPFTGRIMDTLDNKMMVEFDVVNGLKNGEYFLFSFSGKLIAYGFLENNKNIGTWKYYYENGQVECSGEFKDDEPIGKWNWYYEDGVKKCEGLYLKGLPEGKWMKYDNDGYPGLVINFSSGEVISIIEIQKPKMI